MNVVQLFAEDILCSDQPMCNWLTNYYTAPTCFDTTVSSSGSS